jgi:hypothetical protein
MQPQGYKEFNRKGENGEVRKEKPQPEAPFFAFFAFAVSFFISVSA